MSLWSTKVHPGQSGPADRPIPVPEAGGMAAWARDTLMVLPFGEAAFSMIEEHADELCTVMIEPVFGSYCLPVEKAFMQRLREVTQRCGVLLTFDEIITHFRVAFGGGQEHLGVVPDIANYGKVIGGGLPVGAVGCSREIMDAVTQGDDAIAVAGTFSGNAMTLAAGEAMIDYLTANPGIYDDLTAKGDHLRGEFNRFAEERGYPATMTGLGSMFQTHLVPPPINKPRDAAGEDPIMVQDFALLLRLAGVFIPVPLHLAFLSPAHTDEDVEIILEAHKHALETCMAMHNARTHQLRGEAAGLAV
jgi:glutamate-1-semialdehyde 2,1-aminomutase